MGTCLSLDWVWSQEMATYKDDEGVRFRPGLCFSPVFFALGTRAHEGWRFVFSKWREVVRPQNNRAGGADGTVAASKSLRWRSVEGRLLCHGMGVLVSLGLWDHVAADESRSWSGRSVSRQTKPWDLLTVMSLATHRPILYSHANEEVLGAVSAVRSISEYPMERSLT